MGTERFNRPFQEQLDFFRKKLNLPTERWDDIWQAAHDRGFMVAGAQGADLLSDLRTAVDQAIENGNSIGEFRKQFGAIVAKHGWTGWTGEGTEAGGAWRTKVIYQTNMLTSYAAGRWRQLNDPELLKVTPYWQYKHSHSVITPRPLHLSWDGLTLPPGHPFWQTHFPPNGWGCQCRVTAVTKSAYLAAVAAGRGPANAPTGTDGIDAGFGYAPGANADTSLRQIVQDKLISYPPAITVALSRDITKYVNAESPVIDFAKEALQQRSVHDQLWIGFVDRFEEIKKLTDEDVKGYLLLIPSQAVRHVDISHGADGKDQRPPTPEDFQHVWEIFEKGDLSEGRLSRHGYKTIVAWLQIGDERFRCVFEILHGKRNRSLSLLSMLVKSGGR